jgi:hypothetical protein
MRKVDNPAFKHIRMRVLTMCVCLFGVTACESTSSIDFSSVPVSAKSKAIAITSAQAASIAETARERLGGSACGGAVFESESDTVWRYRWLEGYAGEKRGFILISKNDGSYRYIPN